MALDLGEIALSIKGDAATHVLVAATKLHDAVYYTLTPEQMAQLPDAVRNAYGELKRALKMAAEL